MSDNANPSCTAVKTLTVGASTAATASISGPDSICERENSSLMASGGSSIYGQMVNQEIKLTYLKFQKGSILSPLRSLT
ncbi:MAG: hypothetical protein IPJ13_24225 [Saprospiraceae bacterium]|nr:hypothetical protein [Saprospiraceae bacterium]